MSPPILEWFIMKFQELKENLGVSHPKKEENRLKRGVNYSFFLYQKQKTDYHYCQILP